MSDNNEIAAAITTEEPAVAATLDDLRYLVFEGKKGATGDSAYEEAVTLGFDGTEAEWIASLKGETGDSVVDAEYDPDSCTLTLYPGNTRAVVRAISVDELETAPSGAYTLGEVDVTLPIQFPRVQNRGIVIVNTTFNINTPVLFPAFRDDTYFSMPTFIGCTFNNATNGRVLISSGSNDLVGNRFTGCVFNNVDCAESVYLQDFNFTNCYIRSYQTFLNCPTSTVQARFVNCDVEASCKEVVNANTAFVYASGTYEGNNQQNYYFFNATCGVLNFVSAWLESTKLCKIIGGSIVKGQTVLKFDGCDIQINATPMVSVDNPEYVNLVIDASGLVPFNNQAVFIDKTAEQLMSVKGDFLRTYYAGYVKPIGGVLAENRELATIADVNALETKRFYYQRLPMNQAAIQAGGIDIVLPVGRWLVFSGRGDTVRMEYVYANPSSGTQANVRNVIPPVPSNDAYANALRFTATKAAADDTTFTLNVTATEAAYYEVSAIRIS